MIDLLGQYDCVIDIGIITVSRVLVVYNRIDAPMNAHKIIDAAISTVII